MYTVQVVIQKRNEEQAMSIEKKSLISNRIAAKKAIVTKPEGSKVASTKMVSNRVAPHTKVAVTSVSSHPTKVSSHPTKVAMKPNPITSGHTRLAATKLKRL